MSKMIIMKGLPASGKSTKAKELVAQGNTVRINKDLLREMLHFSKFTGINEGLTRDSARNLAKMFLEKGVNVIIDDTNLNPGTVQSWKDLAKELDAKIEYQDLTDVGVLDCVIRDAKREKKVGQSVIEKMALQHLDYLKGEKVVICDLDGTLCDIRHRLHFVKGEDKDWKSFFDGVSEDKVREDVKSQVAELCANENAKVIFVSARPEDYREETEKWLSYKYHHGCTLIMRNSGDRRPDTEVKEEIYEKYLKNLNIIRVFDDRPSVIKMWRDKGLEVEDVGEGIDF